MQYGRIALLVVSIGLLAANEARSAPNVSGKIVLANLDRYDAYLRVGKTRREIKPKKASVLAPRKYPVTIDFWQDNLDVNLGDLDVVDNVELDDLDPDDGFSDYSIDLGDGGDLVEDYDVGDFDIDDTNYDLGGYDDFGGYDGAFDVDTNNFGGGYFGDDDFGDFGGFDDFDF